MCVQFGRSESYRVATTPLMGDDASPTKKKKKLTKAKSKKAEQKEKLEGLKQELDLVSVEMFLVESIAWIFA